MLTERYARVRARSESLCEPLLIEDHVIQSMPDVSPPKWHLGHTSWFFETFILKNRLQGYRLHDPRYGFIFNSYYEAVGARVARAERGLLSRPSVEEVYSYRHHVDRAMAGALELAPELTVLGLHHEQQHQELLLTDIKHILWTNPTRPAYGTAEPAAPAPAAGADWRRFEGGLREIGHAGTGFSFDNELPRHQICLRPYELATRLVTNGEYLEFIASGGYEDSSLWLSDGWDLVQRAAWRAPLYWEKAQGGRWLAFTLEGMKPLDENAPVAHVSFYEADAYARWRGRRLPTEAEWEAAAAEDPRLVSSLWQWTSTAYGPYPGFAPVSGALGEYNGKFMSNRMVLRGGSWATPESHFRISYRNFFDPASRWQFSGVRLAS
jgi:ergothioneine biosynthesis protein EgtB